MTESATIQYNLELFSIHQTLIKKSIEKGHYRYQVENIVPQDILYDRKLLSPNLEDYCKLNVLTFFPYRMVKTGITRFKVLTEKFLLSQIERSDRM